MHDYVPSIAPLTDEQLEGSYNSLLGLDFLDEIETETPDSNTLVNFLEDSLQYYHIDDPDRGEINSLVQAARAKLQETEGLLLRAIQFLTSSVGNVSRLLDAICIVLSPLTTTDEESKVITISIACDAKNGKKKKVLRKKDFLKRKVDKNSSSKMFDRGKSTKVFLKFTIDLTIILNSKSELVRNSYPATLPSTPDGLLLQGFPSSLH